MKILDLTWSLQTATQFTIGANLIGTVVSTIKKGNYSQLCICTDEPLNALYGKKLGVAVSKHLPVITHIFPQGEQAKDLKFLSGLFFTLVGNNADRKTAILAVGGGAISDVSGFGASVYKRGIDWYIYPTTLLSHVDAAIGGKTGVNFEGIKNTLGSFYQPHAVFVDTTTLHSLPKREFTSGMAEIIKYGLILDRELFELLEQGAGNLSSARLEEVIFRCISLKVDIVQQDPQDKGKRALLNFGHTVGHALEANAGLGNLTHGEAISIGMVYAAKISVAMGLAKTTDVDRLKRLLQKFNLPTKIDLPSEKLLANVRRDKKTISGRTKWVLLKSIGEAVSDQEVPNKIIGQILFPDRHSCSDPGSEFI